jgi:hypothetical protein
MNKWSMMTDYASLTDAEKREYEQWLKDDTVVIDKEQLALFIKNMRANKQNRKRNQ